MPDATLRLEPFTAQTTPAALEDLRVRLRATRWPDTPEDAGWSLGTDLTYLRELVAYWAEAFDWPVQEAALAGSPASASRSAVSGSTSYTSGPPPRLGPSCAGAQSRLAGFVLALREGHPTAHRPRRARRRPRRRVRCGRVVAPDMPGYGYSERPAGPPLDSIAVACLWAELMGVLGYGPFGAAGGDIGSDVSRYLGLDHPDRVVAVHRTDAGVPVFSGDPGDLAPEERSMRMYRANAAIAPAQHARRVEVPSGFSLCPYRAATTY